MKKTILILTVLLTSLSAVAQQESSAAVFQELISYIHSCSALRVHRQYRDTAKVQADLAGQSTTQSFLPRIRYGLDERESSDQLDRVRALRVQGSISLNEALYGYKVSDLEAKVESLNSNIKIYDGIAGLVNGFFKWRALSLLHSEIESINKYFSRVKNRKKSKISFSELSQRTDALLIRSKLSLYQTQISFYEKLFADCSKKANLKNPWDIPVELKNVSVEDWSQSLEQQDKLRNNIEKMHCQAKSDLQGVRMEKQKTAWYPKLYYGWSQETGSKIYPDRSGWTMGLEVSIPWPGLPKAAVPTDECQLRLQQESIKETDKAGFAKRQMQELIELTHLRDRWGEVMKETLGAFSLEGNGPKMMSSAIVQFEHLNLQVAELETNLVMSSTFKVSK